jgi:protocatechuate 3,4-dioxygenase beta subunit
VRKVTATSTGLSSQAEINAEIAGLARSASPETAQPLLAYPPYRGSALRHPGLPPHPVDPEAVERHAPVFGPGDVDEFDADLTVQHRGEPLGERIVLAGRVTDSAGRPVAGQLVEIWQANAGGRYIHRRDQHPAPLDPNFTGVGRCLTEPDGSYRFVTIKPGPYPWRNHHNAWRPAHIHFSLFGTTFPERLVTQMYFPGDPLFDLDPIYQSITDPAARALLVARYDHELTEPGRATGYRWDIVLGGRAGTPTEAAA